MHTNIRLGQLILSECFNSMDKVTVVKKDGTEEIFNPQKLKASLQRI